MKTPKDYISFSQMDMYARCGYSYFKRYIEERILPPNGSLILGSKYHLAAEVDMKQKAKSGVNLPLNFLQDFYADSVEGAFAEEVLLSKEEEQKGKLTLRDNIISRGSEAIKIYHNEVAPKMQPLEDGIEKTILVNLGQDLPPLKVVIDLITTDMIVADHKSGAKSPSADTADKSIQLSAYALAFYQEYGFLPNELQLHYAVVTKTGSAKYVPLTTVRDEDQITRFLNRVRLIVDGIRKEVFIPPDQTAWICGTCGYKLIGECPL